MPCCCGGNDLCAAAKPAPTAISVEISNADDFRYDCISNFSGFCGTSSRTFEYLFKGRPINKTFDLEFDPESVRWQSSAVYGCQHSPPTLTDRVQVQYTTFREREVIQLWIPYLIASNSFPPGTSLSFGDMSCNSVRRTWNAAISCSASQPNIDVSVFSFQPENILTFTRPSDCEVSSTSCSPFWFFGLPTITATVRISRNPLP